VQILDNTYDTDVPADIGCLEVFHGYYSHASARPSVPGFFVAKILLLMGLPSGL